MKKLLLYCILLLTCRQASIAGTVDSALINKVDKVITAVKQNYAPDRRTVYFKAEIESDNPLTIKVESSSKPAIEEFKTLAAKHIDNALVKGELLPSASLQGRNYGVANFSVCNNRFQPGNASEMATQVLLGTPVQLLKKERGYYLVRTPDNYLSWTDDSGITQMDSLQFSIWKQGKKIVYTSLYGQAFSKASAKSVPVSDLVAGNILNLLGKEKKFYKVAYPDGRLAYIPVKDANLYSKWVSKANPQQDQIINTAKTMTGIPYLWGGTSTKGFDCSGFTKTCFFLNGIILARDASQQVLNGEPVDVYENDTISSTKLLNNLKAGDLLFFAAEKNNRQDARITHTAIYIGKGDFIQAAGLVRINSFLPSSDLYDKYQAGTLVSARRILTAIGEPGITRIDKHPFYQSFR